MVSWTMSGPNADRQSKSLNELRSVGSNSGADSQCKLRYDGRTVAERAPIRNAIDVALKGGESEDRIGPRRRPYRFGKSSQCGRQDIDR